MRGRIEPEFGVFFLEAVARGLQIGLVEQRAGLEPFAFVVLVGREVFVDAQGLVDGVDVIVLVAIDFLLFESQVSVEVKLYLRGHFGGIDDDAAIELPDVEQLPSLTKLLLLRQQDLDIFDEIAAKRAMQLPFGIVAASVHEPQMVGIEEHVIGRVPLLQDGFIGEDVNVVECADRHRHEYFGVFLSALGGFLCSEVVANEFGARHFILFDPDSEFVARFLFVAEFVQGIDVVARAGAAQLLPTFIAAAIVFGELGKGGKRQALQAGKKQ